AAGTRGHGSADGAARAGLSRKAAQNGHRPLESYPEGGGRKDQLMLTRSESDVERQMRGRARVIVRAGGLQQALMQGLEKLVETSLSEALVLGLLKQGVRKYFAIFGHGSTDLGNVLRIYEEEGVTRT